MYPRIVVDRRVEQAFRRRAIAQYPNEMIEALWGKFVGDEIHIYAFMGVRARYASPVIVSYEEEDLDCHEDESREYGLELVGTIHTHPNHLDGIFSEGDLREVQESQDVVMGICTIVPENIRRKSGTGTIRRTKITYWPAPRPIKVKHR